MVYNNQQEYIVVDWYPLKWGVTAVDSFFMRVLLFALSRRF